jgi:hypothetical protein
MGAPITLTQRELLSLAPEVRVQIVGAVAKKSKKSEEEVFFSQMKVEEFVEDTSERLGRKRVRHAALAPAPPPAKSTAAAAEPCPSAPAYSIPSA